MHRKFISDQASYASSKQLVVVHLLKTFSSAVGSAAQASTLNLCTRP